MTWTTRPKLQPLGAKDDARCGASTSRRLCFVHMPDSCAPPRYLVGPEGHGAAATGHWLAVANGNEGGEMHAPGTPACPVTSPRSIREASSSPAPPGWVDATAPRATLPRVNQRHARDAHLARRYEQRLRRPSSSARWLEDPVPLRTGSAAVLSHALITTHASEEARSGGSEQAAKSVIKRRSTTSGKRRGTTSRQVARSRLLIWRAGGGGGRQLEGRVTEIRAECRVVADGGRAVDVHVEHGY